MSYTCVYEKTAAWSLFARTIVIGIAAVTVALLYTPNIPKKCRPVNRCIRRLGHAIFCLESSFTDVRQGKGCRHSKFVDEHEKPTHRTHAKEHGKGPHTYEPKLTRTERFNEAERL